MINSTVVALIPHLENFFTQHPQVATAANAIAGVDYAFPAKFTQLNADLTREKGQAGTAQQAKTASEMELENLEDEMAALAECLESFFAAYAARTGHARPYPSFVRHGDTRGNLRNFLAALATESGTVAEWDAHNLLPALQGKFARYDELFAAQADKTTTADAEKGQMEQFLAANAEWVLLAYATALKVCELRLPALLGELRGWRHTATHRATTPAAPVVPPESTAANV